MTPHRPTQTSQFVARRRNAIEKRHKPVLCSATERRHRSVQTTALWRHGETSQSGSSVRALRGSSAVIRRHANSVCHATRYERFAHSQGGRCPPIVFALVFRLGANGCDPRVDKDVVLSALPLDDKQPVQRERGRQRGRGRQTTRHAFAASSASRDISYLAYVLIRTGVIAITTGR